MVFCESRCVFSLFTHVREVWVVIWYSCWACVSCFDKMCEGVVQCMSVRKSDMCGFVICDVE